MAAVECTGGAVKVWTDRRDPVPRCWGVPPTPLAHRDVWERALRVWRPGVSSSAWAKAQLEWEAAMARGILRHAWEGNRRADELAGKGAATHAMAEQSVERILWAVDATERAHLWMAEALQLG